MPVDVSVIIPTRGRPQLLAEQLESLAAQVFSGSWEIVIADNSPTGGAGASASGVERARVIDASERPGPAYACNAGAASSTGHSLLFLDDDDVLAPGYVEAMAEALRRDEFVASRIDQHTLNPWGGLVHYTWQDTGLQEGGFLPSAAGGTLGIRRSLFERMGGFDDGLAYAQDIDLCWRVALEGVPLRFVPDALLFYRPRADLVSHARQQFNWGRSDVALYDRYRKHGYQRTPGEATGEWVKALKALLRARTKSQVAWGVGVAAHRLGRLRGSIRHRVFFP